MCRIFVDCFRIYRETNVSGFVKGFTDAPESLLAGFGKLEKVKTTHLPMFQTLTVHGDLKENVISQVIVVETPTFRRYNGFQCARPPWTSSHSLIPFAAPAPPPLPSPSPSLLSPLTPLPRPSPYFLFQLMRNLGVAKVFLWPRFHSLVTESLERNPPKVEEMVQKLSGPTKEVRPIVVFPLPPYSLPKHVFPLLPT